MTTDYLVLQVSWLRGRDSTVLSVGNATFSSDSRFRVRHSKDGDREKWNLQVREAHRERERSLVLMKDAQRFI